MNMENKNSELRYKLDEKPPFPKAMILSFQTILTTFGGIVAVPLIVAEALGLPFSEITFWISCALLVSGIVTVIQAHGLGKIGSRLPIVMGTSFAFVGISINVGKNYGIAAMFCASMVAALLEVVLSGFIKPLKRFLPPVVTGTVVTLIGLTIIPVAINWLAGGVGSPNYGSIKNIVVGLIIMVIIVVLNQFGNEFLSSAAIVIGIVCGYVLAAFTGMLDFSSVGSAAIFSIPKPFKYGFKLNVASILAFIPVYLVATVETVGSTLAIGVACEHEVNGEELAGGVLCDGIGSVIAGVFNAGANTTFSQCTGLVNVTGVASRFVGILAGVLLIIAGLIPKFGALVAAMPNPVLGGAGIIMFGMIAGAGIKMLGEVKFDRRNMLVVSVSLTLGLGVIFEPNILSNFPTSVQTIFGSGVTTGTIAAILLNIILPKNTSVDKNLDKDESLNS
ncbi:nucleobase:cation symporter-2 family protein [Clostridium sp. MB40-C1]|uniref:uracil-xanthine permease family protein n=1 Tax=Clostridium sp. MB40-C1 TaxID=3070996 RepID=UPI0027DFEE61|nr:nucleobase:cation symporter-2 family protein [Clostridium sp. MB40-C1]WMJ79742.1 nucleobase:cation symporter-2 family protein [Clostridium sp. MB40-C1]